MHLVLNLYDYCHIARIGTFTNKFYLCKSALMSILMVQ